MTSGWEVTAGARSVLLSSSKSSSSLLIGVLLVVSCVSNEKYSSNQAPPPDAIHALQNLKSKYAPANQFGLYMVGLSSAGGQLALTGIVDNIEAAVETEKAMRSLGLSSSNGIRVLPEASLGERTWGIATLSVSSARELPDHKAELGIQVLMGRVVRVLQRGTNAMWYYVQSADGYCAWLERGTFSRCTQSEAEAWTNSSLLFVSAMEEVIWSKPDRTSEPVSDIVLADLLKKTGEQGEWYEVELPDKRKDFYRKLPQRITRPGNSNAGQRQRTSNIRRECFLGVRICGAAIRQKASTARALPILCSFSTESN